MKKQEAIKQLECLYSWAEFYSKNQQWDAYNKCEIQIIEHKKSNNLD